LIAEPLLGDSDGYLRAEDEGICRPVGTSNAAAQLVELGKPPGRLY
jgi:hypothetical protein